MIRMRQGSKRLPLLGKCNFKSHYPERRVGTKPDSAMVGWKRLTPGDMTLLRGEAYHKKNKREQIVRMSAIRGKPLARISVLQARGVNQVPADCVVNPGALVIRGKGKDCDGDTPARKLDILPSNLLGSDEVIEANALRFEALMLMKIRGWLKSICQTSRLKVH